ncbi:hypothetical protein B0J11DRAFT_578158 [Dendryphion nanum]|uniref:Uncharacterized protein n=1 Tax=Dendryphion nanum TaxID=256645 RepID=A0A9P9IPV9_9PLEO|nr:hypothetical protein B0J11DRAFT_578158 [Dendryphion nanum]
MAKNVDAETPSLRVFHPNLVLLTHVPSEGRLPFAPGIGGNPPVHQDMSQWPQTNPPLEFNSGCPHEHIPEEEVRNNVYHSGSLAVDPRNDHYIPLTEGVVHMNPTMVSDPLEGQQESASASDSLNEHMLTDSLRQGHGQYRSPSFSPDTGGLVAGESNSGDRHLSAEDQANHRGHLSHYHPWLQQGHHFSGPSHVQSMREAPPRALFLTQLARMEPWSQYNSRDGNNGTALTAPNLIQTGSEVTNESSSAARSFPVFSDNSGHTTSASPSQEVDFSTLVDSQATIGNEHAFRNALSNTGDQYDVLQSPYSSTISFSADGDDAANRHPEEHASRSSSQSVKLFHAITYKADSFREKAVVEGETLVLASMKAFVKAHQSIVSTVSICVRFPIDSLGTVISYNGSSTLSTILHQGRRIYSAFKFPCS